MQSCKYNFSNITLLRDLPEIAEKRSNVLKNKLQNSQQVRNHTQQFSRELSIRYKQTNKQTTVQIHKIILKL